MWRCKAQTPLICCCTPGTLFVHKVAGYLSHRGCALMDMHATCCKVAAHVRSIGIALSECTIPGRPAPPQRRIGPGEAELVCVYICNGYVFQYDNLITATTRAWAFTAKSGQRSCN